MSEQLNIEAVRRISQLAHDGDLPAILKMVADDVELFLFGSSKVPWATGADKSGPSNFLWRSEAAEVRITGRL